MFTEERIQYQDDFFLRKCSKYLRNYGISCPTTDILTDKINSRRRKGMRWCLGAEASVCFIIRKIHLMPWFLFAYPRNRGVSERQYRKWSWNAGGTVIQIVTGLFFSYDPRPRKNCPRKHPLYPSFPLPHIDSISTLPHSSGTSCKAERIRNYLLSRARAMTLVKQG
ncbi:hypothetical protein ACJIZ3_000056 [Penstemon smallii]|uniref:Uncharacterized protein n=1 Tax=Penstemon smallii TaxID=265156 RepID=A0ABD3RF09_9LAMI